MELWLVGVEKQVLLGISRLAPHPCLTTRHVSNYIASDKILQSWARMKNTDGRFTFHNPSFLVSYVNLFLFGTTARLFSFSLSSLFEERFRSSSSYQLPTDLRAALPLLSLQLQQTFATIDYHHSFFRFSELSVSQTGFLI